MATLNDPQNDSKNDSMTKARIDLTAALRWAARLGLNEGIDNHFSMSAPGRPDLFLVNPHGLHWSEITPGDLVLVDFDGQVVEGKHGVEATAFYIHGRIHRGNARANVVLHTHMPYATALTICDGGRLEMANQNALRYYGRVAYDEAYHGLVLDFEEGDRLGALLENADVLFMANHGIIVCGATVAQAFDDLYFLERACQVQVLAQSTGKALKLVPDSIAALTAQQIANDQQQPVYHLAALQRLLDRQEPGWSAMD